MAKRRAITFKHITGSLKDIPGISNKMDLAPRLIQDTERVIGGQVRTVLKRDESHVAKIYLFDEDTGAKLTEKEKTYSQAVQDTIMARRAAQTDIAIQANEAIRERLLDLEAQGEIKVLDWDAEVDDSTDKKLDKITAMSDIALADYADRGIDIPDHLKKTAIKAAVAEKSGVVVKGTLPKEKKTEE